MSETAASAHGSNGGGFLLSQAHQLSSRTFERLLRDAGLDGLSAARGRIVHALLREDGIVQMRLAEQVKLDKSSLALTLRELEADGLVRRSPAPGDRRAQLVFRGERFLALLDRFEAVSALMTQCFYRGFSDEDITAFETALRKIIANLEAPPDLAP